jgi:hypothetical protein
VATDDKENKRIMHSNRCKVILGLLSIGFATFVAISGAYAEEPSPVSASTAPPLKVALVQISTNWHARQGLYYKRNWGVEIIGMKPVTSGYMLAFRYRVLDPEKAKLLNDRQTKAYVIDEASGIRLAVPAMENVGELRSGTAPEAGRTYFMIFGNPGKLVKSGSRISVVVGNFSVEGLVVD